MRILFCMSNERLPPLLARLETGFHTDSARLLVLQEAFEEMVRQARGLAKKRGFRDGVDRGWEREWDQVEGILNRTKALVLALEATVEGGAGTVRVKDALEVWEDIQIEDARLVASLGILQTLATRLEVPFRREWNWLAKQLEGYFEVLHARAKALRIKLELLKEHSREEVERLIQDVFSTLPARDGVNDVDLEIYDREYRRATVELEQEREKFLGFADVLKGLFMWVETPEERLRKNLSIEVQAD